MGSLSEDVRLQGSPRRASPGNNEHVVHDRHTYGDRKLANMDRTPLIANIGPGHEQRGRRTPRYGGHCAPDHTGDELVDLVCDLVGYLER